MIKWMNNVVSTMIFFLTYLIVYYIFAKEVTLSLLGTSLIFFILLIIYDIFVYNDR